MNDMRALMLTMLLAMALTVEAQEKEKVETNVGADFVSEYIWRGQELGHVSMQPTLGISYKGFSIDAWGSVGLSDSSDTKEFDLTIGYSFGNLNIGLTDYWTNAGLDPQSRYFKYDAHGTNHVFEANVGYDFGLASVQWYTNFAGNDGVNNSGKRAYSSFAEVSVPFSLVSVDWNATVGVVPYATDYYGTTGFAVTDLTLKASKDIRVTDSFSIPVFGQVTANPCSQKAYLVVGFTLRP